MKDQQREGGIDTRGLEKRAHTQTMGQRNGRKVNDESRTGWMVKQWDHYFTNSTATTAATKPEKSYQKMIETSWRIGSSDKISKNVKFVRADGKSEEGEKLEKKLLVIQHPALFFSDCTPTYGRGIQKERKLVHVMLTLTPKKRSWS
jgi:hypothetical protein